jgi:hypothetical protein
MRKILVSVIVMVLLAMLLGGCAGANYYSFEDKQPVLTVVPMAVTLENPFVGGNSSNLLQYGVRVWVNKSGQEIDRSPARPLNEIRFDLHIRTYDINQEFKVAADIPYATNMSTGLPFPTYRDLVDNPMEGAAKNPISDNGRGPGGVVVIPAAVWTPAPSNPTLLRGYQLPDGEYHFTFVITDSNGYDSIGYATVHVYDTVIETVLDPTAG